MTTVFGDLTPTFRTHGFDIAGTPVVPKERSGEMIDTMDVYGARHGKYVEALMRKQTLVAEKDRVEAQELWDKTG